jgi:hypothetical protein
MTFTVTRLIGSRALVRGEDVTGNTGETVLDTTQWDELNQHKAVDAATAEFDKAVEEFFAPLTKAAEAVGKKLERPTDEIDFVVVHEGVDPVAGVPAHVVRLTHDSKVLRLIEGGNDQRLVWVMDHLEILDVDTTAPVAAVADVLGGQVTDFDGGPANDGPVDEA